MSVISGYTGKTGVTVDDAAAMLHLPRSTASARPAARSSRGIDAVLSSFDKRVQHALRQLAIERVELEVRKKAILERISADAGSSDRVPEVLISLNSKIADNDANIRRLGGGAASILLDALKDPVLASSLQLEVPTEDDAGEGASARVWRRQLDTSRPQANTGRSNVTHDSLTATGDRTLTTGAGAPRDATLSYYQKQQLKYGRGRRGSTSIAGAWEGVFSEGGPGGTAALAAASDPAANAAAAAAAAAAAMGMAPATGGSPRAVVHYPPPASADAAAGGGGLSSGAAATPSGATTNTDDGALSALLARARRLIAEAAPGGEEEAPRAPGTAVGGGASVSGGRSPAPVDTSFGSGGDGEADDGLDSASTWAERTASALASAKATLYGGGATGASAVAGGFAPGGAAASGSTAGGGGGGAAYGPGSAVAAALRPQSSRSVSRGRSLGPGSVSRGHSLGPGSSSTDADGAAAHRARSRSRRGSGAGISVVSGKTNRTAGTAMTLNSSAGVFAMPRNTHSARSANARARGFDSVLASFHKGRQYAIREMAFDIAELLIRKETIEARMAEDALRAASDPVPRVLVEVEAALDERVRRLVRLVGPDGAELVIAAVNDPANRESMGLGVETEDAVREDAGGDEASVRIWRRKLDATHVQPVRGVRGENHAATHDDATNVGGRDLFNLLNRQDPTETLSYYQKQQLKYGRGRRGSTSIAGAWEAVYGAEIPDSSGASVAGGGGTSPTGSTYAPHPGYSLAAAAAVRSRSIGRSIAAAGGAASRPASVSPKAPAAPPLAAAAGRTASGAGAAAMAAVLGSSASVQAPAGTATTSELQAAVAAAAARGDVEGLAALTRQLVAQLEGLKLAAGGGY